MRVMRLLILPLTLFLSLSMGENANVFAAGRQVQTERRVGAQPHFHEGTDSLLSWLTTVVLVCVC